MFENVYSTVELKALYTDRENLDMEILRKFPQAAEPIEFEDGEVISKKCAQKTRKRNNIVNAALG